MSTEEAPSNERFSERITQLEEFCTFLQRTVNELDHVVLKQQQRIESLETRLVRMTTHFERLAQQTYDPPRPEDEKPPHY